MNTRSCSSKITKKVFNRRHKKRLKNRTTEPHKIRKRTTRLSSKTKTLATSLPPKKLKNSSSKKSSPLEDNKSVITSQKTKKNTNPVKIKRTKKALPSLDSLTPSSNQGRLPPQKMTLDDTVEKLK